MLNRMVFVGGVVVAVVISILVAPTSVFATGCPLATESSPGFRTYLPGCRAYEMVTPPYKDGDSNMSVKAVSSDGLRVIASSFSAFSGTESDPLNGASGAVYEFARAGSGWVASSVTPPTSLSPNAHLFGVSADGSRVLWEVLGPSRSIYSTSLDIREPNDSFVEIGPLIPPGGATGPPAENHGGENEYVGFVGASKDLSHVLFTIYAVHPEFLWPGDTTQPETTKKSLYEYVGTGNKRPMLVGVGEEGLISNCGTTLGYTELPGGADAYNAMSTNGEIVFFTPVAHENSNCEPTWKAPEVDELYARVDQIQTVAISEPSFSQCTLCRTGIPTLEEPATTEKRSIFQGASEDGSKAFFLTEQELFEGDTGENLYEYDFDDPVGEKVVRVSGGSPKHESLDPEVQGVARVAEDGSRVYFVAKAALTGPNKEGNIPAEGADNLYLFERDANYPAGRTAFVATLSPEDSEDWHQGDSRPMQATPEGRFLVFQSAADLTPGDKSGQSQIFEYDALREELVRLSVGAAGYVPGVANAELNPSFIQSQSYGQASAPTNATTDLAVSEDGSRVLFYGSGALAEGAEAGTLNVYEYRSEGAAGSIANGNVHLLDANASSTEAIGLDASGVDAFFLTADPLVPTDVDTQIDVYDAREDGGFPASVVQAACVGETCQGPPSTPLSVGAPGSVSASGDGNLAAQMEAAIITAPKLKPKI